MSLWPDYHLAYVVILTRPSPNMFVFDTLPHHDFSCCVIVARNLPDMLYPCDQIFASHVKLWPDNHITDYVTLTSSTAHSFAIAATYPCSYFIVVRPPSITQLLLPLSFRISTLFRRHTLLVEPRFCQIFKTFGSSYFLLI